MPQWMQDLVSGWPMIRANPVTFILIVAVIIGGVWVVIGWSYSSVFASKNSQIELQDRQLADYKEKLQGATPDQAKARIDALEARLEARLSAIEPRRLTQERRSKLASDLKPPWGATYALSISSEMSGDSAQYGSDITAAFQEAGNWNISSSSVVGLGYRPPTGIAVTFSNAAPPTQAALLIIDAFRKSNIPIDVRNAPTRPGFDVEILVATKLAP